MFYLSDTTRVRFKHTVANGATGVVAVFDDAIPHVVKGTTLCKIEMKNTEGEWDIWEQGVSICSKEETSFVKSVGRKLALTRALENVEPRELRRDFWEAYFRNVKR